MYKSVMPGRNRRESVRRARSSHVARHEKNHSAHHLHHMLIALSHLTAGEAFAARSHLSKDPKVQAARGLLKQRRYIKALQDYCGPIARESKGRADRTDVLFPLRPFGHRGFQAPASGKSEGEVTALLDAAIAALRAILIEKPALVRVRLRTRAGVLLQARGRPLSPPLRSRSRRQAAQADGLQHQSFPAHHAGAQTLERAFRIFHRAGHEHRRGVGFGDHLYLRSAFPPQRVRGRKLGTRLRLLGRMGVSASTGRAPAHALGREYLPPGIRGEPLRSNDGLPPRRAALVDKSQHRDEPARQRAPAQKRRPHPQPRVRRALRTRTPPHAPHPSERARFLARARLRNQ